jgi:uncharacterized membrane protein YoaK (UPF0700 family)
VQPGRGGAAGGPVGGDGATLALAAVLAAVAGAVDAVTFQRVAAVFPANHSGNLIIVGMSVGTGAWTTLLRSSVAIVAFAAGVTGAVLLRRRWSRPRPERLLVVEAVLLVGSVAVMVAGLPDDGRPERPVAGLLVALLSFSMGIQTEVIRRTMGLAVSTTYESTAVVRLAEAAVGAGGERAPRSRIPRAALVAAPLLVAYVGGATAGAAARGWPVAVLVVVVVVVGVSAVAAGRLSGPQPAAPAPPSGPGPGAR